VTNITSESVGADPAILGCKDPDGESKPDVVVQEAAYSLTIVV